MSVRKPRQFLHEGKTKAPATVKDAAHRRRHMLAALCKFLGKQVGAPPPGIPSDLTPRVRQTLLGLLRGLSEKEIARELGLSPNTVHVYVKTLYQRFEVSSRGELLSKFVHTSH